MNLYEILSENSSFVEAVTADLATGPDSLDTYSTPDSSPDWTPPTFGEVAEALGCHVCDACYRQWCMAVPGRAYYSARFLRACPKTRQVEGCLPIIEQVTI